MLKKIIIIAALMLPVSLVAQEIKFGHLDKQKLVESMPEATKAQAELKKFLDQKQAEGAKMEQELQTAITTFQQEAESLDPAVRQTREEGLRLKQANLQSFATQAEQELMQKQQELMQPIEIKITTALKKVGEEQGLIYIFDSVMPLYTSAQSIDVLPMVQKIVNAPAATTRR
jgi:outer membrane protein